MRILILSNVVECKILFLQIFDDYGFDFSMALKAQRNDYCQKYFFTCECEACKDNWPVFNELPSILVSKNRILTTSMFSRVI